MAPSRIATTTSSHHQTWSSKLQPTNWERSVGSPSVQRGYEIGETNGHGGEASDYEDAPNIWAF